MATETVNININAKDNASPALKKVQMNLREVGEKVSQLGMRMSAAFTAPVLAMGALVLKNEEVQKSLEPIKAAFKGVGDELAVSLLPVIEELTPALLSLAKSLSDIIAKFDALPTGTKKTILGFVAVVAAIGPVLVIVGQLISTVGTLQTLLPTLAAGFQAVGTSASMALGPIAAIGAGLVAAQTAIANIVNEIKKMTGEGKGKNIAIDVVADVLTAGFYSATKNLGLAPRANGGPVMAGQSYIVGERQPEIFTPNQNGYISPSVNGRGGVTVNVSFSSAVSLTDEREAARKLVPIIKQAMRLA